MMFSENNFIFQIKKKDIKLYFRVFNVYFLSFEFDFINHFLCKFRIRINSKFIIKISKII
jgi:hypothetical protein